MRTFIRRLANSTLSVILLPFVFLSFNFQEKIDPKIEEMAYEDASLGAKIISASPTLDQFPLKNLFDDSPLNNYVVAKNKGQFSFTIGLNKARVIDKIEIIFGKENYATEFKIENVDYIGTVFNKIVDVKNGKGSSYIFHIPDKIESSYLKFTFSKIYNNNELVIKRIKIYAEPIQGIISELTESDFQNILFAADDPSNPLHIFHAPIRQGAKTISDAIIGGENLTDHQKIVKFMNYLNDFKVGFASEPLPLPTLLEKIGACGPFTNTLLALAKAQGIDGRIINLMNYPKGFGHTVAELYVDGRWQLYDPTYAVYYTYTPEDMEHPIVLSFEDLRNGKGRDANVKRVITNDTRIKAQGEFALDFIGPDIYEFANPAGVIGPDKPFLYPLYLDYQNKPSLHKNEFLTSTLYQGANYIGAAGVNNMQLWTINNLVPGQSYEFVIDPDWLSWGHDHFKLDVSIKGGIPISENSIIFSEPFDAKSYKFKAVEEKVELKLTHNYYGPENHYIMIEEYMIKQID